jgi:hypothetical protein
MEERNSQNKRLAKKKGSCRISIVLWAWLLGYTSTPQWNPPRPHCMLCTIHEPMDRNYLGLCTALSSRSECESYWEATTKMMENWLRSFSITIFVTTPFYWDFYIYFECFFSLLLFSLCFFLFYCTIYNVILFFSFIGHIGQW